MKQDTNSSNLPQILGSITILGCIIAAICDLAGIALTDRIGLMSDTISNLAAGPYDWVSDFGLYAFVAGVIAAAIGLNRWHIDRWDWRTAKVLLIVLALVITAIATYEAYSTGDGTVIHYRLVYVLGAAFPLTVLLTAGQFYDIDKRLGWAMYIGGAVWAIMGPFLFLIPTEYDGGYERLLAMMMMGWFVIAGVLIYRNPDVNREISDDQQH